ncbi:MAG TPA: methyl-accepting chemotaxis protein [Haliangium sp.]|nr:methyl-accepting chemotaxis protein [Haliangium sp.]
MRRVLPRSAPAGGPPPGTGRILLAVSVTSFFTTSSFGALFLYLGPRSLGILALIMAVPIGGAAILMRWTRSVSLAAHVYLFSLWLLLNGVALALGGVYSPAFPGYALLILGGTFMLGRRAGVWWTCLTVASMVLVQLAQGQVMERLQVSQEALTLFNLLAFVGVYVLVSIFALHFDRAKNSALDELRRANQRIAQMIAHLEQTSDRLILSSERFLGRDAQSGLIRRMMKKARSGHTALEQSRTSFSGMIDQYRRIAERVQALHRYSQLIVELVSTIDRISDRLDMIALNVGIEASRSGEVGKQFSILAGDMRGLAERVLSETRQIKAALHNVHEQIQQVLESSASGQVLTEESASRISDMARTFDEIHALVEETESAAGQITEDTLAQIAAVRRLITVAARVEA